MTDKQNSHWSIAMIDPKTHCLVTRPPPSPPKLIQLNTAQHSSTQSLNNAVQVDADRQTAETLAYLFGRLDELFGHQVGHAVGVLAVASRGVGSRLHHLPLTHRMCALAVRQGEKPCQSE